MTFAFNQTITRTSNGKQENAVFIGYMRDGREAQVCLCDRKFKPNVIVPTGELSGLIVGAKTTRKAKAENAGHEQPSDMGATAL